MSSSATLPTPENRCVSVVAEAGRLLAKWDVKSAFRLIRVRPQDWHLLGFTWRDRFFFDTALLFGLSSSPALWEELATLLEWIVHDKLGLEVSHYVDDFIAI